MLLTKFVEVGIGGRNYNHYKELGYDLCGHTPILVKVEDLTHGSNVKVSVKCDYCLEPFEKSFKSLMRGREQSFTKRDCCPNCILKKGSETNLEKYGVENVFSNSEIKEKIKKTNLEKYGVENPTKNDEIKKKVRETWGLFSEEKIKEIAEKKVSTNLLKYGAPYFTLTKLFLEKTKETCLQKYGIDNVANVDAVREKYISTCLEKYGTTNYFSSEEFKTYIKKYWEEKEGVSTYSKTKDFREKMKSFWKNISHQKIEERKQKTRETCLKKYGLEFSLQLPYVRKCLYDKNGYPTSKKQLMLFELVKELFPDALENIEMHPYLLDILISVNNVNLVIEYDCQYWHSPHKDELKNNFLFSKNFKVLRIKSGRNIPEKNILFQNICELLDTSKKYGEIVLEDWDEEKYRGGSK